MRSVTFLVVCAALVLGGVIAAQQGPVFRSAAQTVAIYATVLDRDGRLVTHLEREHFEVLDNGVPQPLTVFQSDIQPITVVVMLDVSGSMTLNIERLKLAAEQFVLRLLPFDRARVGYFSDLIRISPRFTPDRDELIRILHEEIGFGNPTYLWDAIDDSMSALASESGRRVVLIFTDGEDDKSARYDFDHVLERAVNEEFMIYAIGMRSEIPALGMVTRPDRNLRRLAEETGGGYYELREDDDLAATFTQVAEELHRQYVLGFAPPSLDGTVHQLDVRTRVDGMRVRARRSYLAVPDASLPDGDLIAPPTE